jgi:hypothetical protein
MGKHASSDYLDPRWFLRRALLRRLFRVPGLRATFLPCTTVGGRPQGTKNRIGGPGKGGRRLAMVTRSNGDKKTLLQVLLSC